MCRLRQQDQLPGRLSRLQVAMRLRRLRQRERLADVELEPALAYEREAPLGALARLVGKAPRQGRQRERADLLRLRGEDGEVERIRRAARVPVEDEVAEGRQAAKPFLEGWLADGVQDEIDAAIAGQAQHLVGELLLRIVDHRVGAGFFREPGL